MWIFIGVILLIVVSAVPPGADRLYIGLLGFACLLGGIAIYVLKKKKGG